MPSFTITDCVVSYFLHGCHPSLQLRTDEMNGKVEGEDEEEEYLDEEEEGEDDEDEEEHPEEEEGDEKEDILDEKRKETEKQEQSITESDLQVP